MNRLSSILAWLGVSLAVICLLPIGLLWHHIDADQEQRNQQTLNTQLLNARAAIQSLAARIASTSRTLTTLGKVPAIYLETDSAQTQRLLRNAVETEPGVLGLDLVMRDAHGKTLVAGVRKERLSEAVVSALFSTHDPPVSIATVDGRALVGISVETSRRGVWLLATLVGQDAWSGGVALRKHRQTQFVLAQSQTGNILSGPVGAPKHLPATLWLPELSVTGQSLSLLAQWPDIGPGISAVAPITGTDLQLISRQAPYAGHSEHDVSHTRWAFLVVLGVVAAMLFCVIPVKVIRPIWLLVSDARNSSDNHDLDPEDPTTVIEIDAGVESLEDDIHEQPTQQWTAAALNEEQSTTQPQRVGSGKLNDA